MGLYGTVGLVGSYKEAYWLWLLGSPTKGEMWYQEKVIGRK